MSREFWEDALEFERWIGGLEVVPTLVSLREKVERIKAGEEAKLLKKLSHLPERDVDSIRRFGSSLIAQILHEPSVRLREGSDSRARTKLMESVRILFDLKVEDEKDGERS